MPIFLVVFFSVPRVNTYTILLHVCAGICRFEYPMLLMFFVQQCNLSRIRMLLLFFTLLLKIL